MRADSFLAQSSEQLQCMRAVQLQPVVLDWHLVTPSTVHHDLAAEVQFEEKLVHQAMQRLVGDQILHNGNLYLGGVHVQLERHEIFFGRNLLDDTHNRLRIVSVCRNGRVEEVIIRYEQLWHAGPEVVGLQQSHLPSVNRVEADVVLSKYIREFFLLRGIS